MNGLLTVLNSKSYFTAICSYPSGSLRPASDYRTNNQMQAIAFHICVKVTFTTGKPTGAYTSSQHTDKLSHNNALGLVRMKSTFRDVKADILSKITSGIWGPGSLVPNEIDLAETYGCARATVNRAMRELADEGIIERRRKAGTRVRMAPIRQARFDIPIVRSEIEEQGAAYRYTLVSRKVGEAPNWLRARLQLTSGGEVLHLVCMHYADGNPYQHEDRWINLAALPQAREADFSSVGPNEWLVSTIPFSDAEISFSATSADLEMAEYLGCTQGDPLFTTERSTWWESRAITYVKLSFRPGHRMTARY